MIIGSSLKGLIAIIVMAIAGGWLYTPPDPPEFKESEGVSQVLEQKIDNVPEPKKKASTEPLRASVELAGCGLAYKYDWPADTAKAVCMAESRGRTTATNMSDGHHNCDGSYGLMQVGCFWAPYYGHKVEDLYNPEVNMELAYKIYKRTDSFGAWTTYTRGLYRNYL